jgi:N-acyl homoserine lactone hydrolase
MTKIHIIQTGTVKIKNSQRRQEGKGGLGKVLWGKEWTEWLPIYAWVIEHQEALIVVDTGETARTAEAGYFPRWQPYYKLAVRMDVSPEQEIGPQMKKLGLDPEDVKQVILTHLHTDHAGGMHHFPNSKFLVSEKEYRSALGLPGMIQGYLPHRWPEWFSPQFIQFEHKGTGPFEESYSVTKAGDVTIVPTPGHTPNHTSVIVRIDEISYFLAGDTSYEQDLLLEKHPDGVSPNPGIARQTMEKILQYAQSEKTVYLPTHDLHSENRLKNRKLLTP